MSTIIKPTVGRVVWFYPSNNTAEVGFALPPVAQPLAAIVARVWSDSMINLTVFDANGVPHSRTSVSLLQDGQPTPINGYYATWMPYQVKQQAGADLIASVSPQPPVDNAPAPTSKMTFDEFVQFGRDQGVPLTNNMPWSFEFMGQPVTHENDKCYLIGSGPGQFKFTSDEVMGILPAGEKYLPKATPLMPRTKSA